MKTRMIVLTVGIYLGTAQPLLAIPNRFGMTREEIKALPICDRPQRIGHFYGRIYRYMNCGVPLLPHVAKQRGAK